MRKITVKPGLEEVKIIVVGKHPLSNPLHRVMVFLSTQVELLDNGIQRK